MKKPAKKKTSPAGVAHMHRQRWEGAPWKNHSRNYNGDWPEDTFPSAQLHALGQKASPLNYVNIHLCTANYAPLFLEDCESKTFKPEEGCINIDIRRLKDYADEWVTFMLSPDAMLLKRLEKDRKAVCHQFKREMKDYLAAAEERWGSIAEMHDSLGMDDFDHIGKLTSRAAKLAATKKNLHRIDVTFKSVWDKHTEDLAKFGVSAERRELPDLTVMK